MDRTKPIASNVAELTSLYKLTDVFPSAIFVSFSSKTSVIVLNFSVNAKSILEKEICSLNKYKLNAYVKLYILSIKANIK